MTAPGASSCVYHSELRGDGTGPTTTPTAAWRACRRTAGHSTAYLEPGGCWPCSRHVLGIRDAVVARLQAASEPIPSALSDWRVKRVLGALESEIARKRATLPASLLERFEANWPALIHQIRTVRNEAGHPISIEPVTAEAVHASLLVFPEIAVLATQIQEWIGANP